MFKKPEIQTAHIEKLTHEGNGLAHINGKVTFIRGALPDEEVLFRYTKKHQRRDEGEVLEIQQPSPFRVIPPCPHSEVCGGCNLQHLQPEKQIEHKQAVLLELLQHFGKVSPETILPAITGANLHYRHKARLSVRFVIKKNRLLVGFHEKNGRYTADISSCVVLHASVGNKIAALQVLITSLEAKDHIAQIEVAVGDHQTALVFRNLQPLSNADRQKLIEFGKENQFEIYLQPGNVTTVHKIFPNDNRDRLSYSLPNHGVELLFHPCDFTQINQQINLQLVDRVLEALQLKPTDNLLDLFCGIGNFTIPLAKYCHHVCGVEAELAMVKRGYENAAHNNITNVNFFAADLNQDIFKHEWTKNSCNKLLIDPPRVGALEVIKQLPSLPHRPERIVYVSCNPATLARDVGELVHNQQYKLLAAGVIDMFPHTSHVESIAILVND